MQIPIQRIGKQITRFFPYLVILILLLLLNRQCKKTDNVFSFYENEKQEVEYYKNKLGSVTASVNASELSNKQLKKLVLQKDDSLKKLVSEFSGVKTIVKTHTVFERDTIYIPFETEVPCEFDLSGKFRSDKWIGFDYTLDNKSLSLHNINVPNEITIITGTKRNWFLGKQYLTTDITNSNPYVKTQEIQSIVVPVPVEWYNSKWVWFGAGVVGGVLISK